MTGRIQALVRTLGGEMDQEELLVMLCQAAEMELAGRLRPGLTPEDCESAFVPAAALLARYGQSVALHRGEETVRTQAFLQPVTERDRAQEAPSPLGLRREDRFLYLGKPEEPLTPGCWVEWNGTGYEVQTAHPIQAGGRTSHVWAVLRPRDREAGA